MNSNTGTINYMKTGFNSSNVSPEHLMHLIEEERQKAGAGMRFLYSFSDSIDEVDYYLSMALGYVVQLPVKAVRAVGRSITTLRIRSSGEADTQERLEMVRDMWERDDEDGNIQTFNIGNTVYQVLYGLSIGLAVSAATFGGYGLYKAGDILIMSSDGEKTLEGFGSTMRLLGAISAVAGGFQIALAYTSLGHLLVKFVVKKVKQVYGKVSTSYRNNRQARLLRKEQETAARATRAVRQESARQATVQQPGAQQTGAKVKADIREVATTATVKAATAKSPVGKSPVAESVDTGSTTTARSHRRIRTQRQR